MRVELLLRRRQSAAEALMWGHGTARRAGEPITDSDGVVTTPLGDVYSGKFKTQTTVAQAKTPIAGGHAFTVENLQLHFPVNAPMETDDIFTAESHRDDPSITGKTFRLVELARGSQRTAARWNVELVTA